MMMTMIVIYYAVCTYSFLCCRKLSAFFTWRTPEKTSTVVGLDQAILYSINPAVSLTFSIPPATLLGCCRFDKEH